MLWSQILIAPKDKFRNPDTWYVCLVILQTRHSHYFSFVQDIAQTTKEVVGDGNSEHVRDVAAGCKPWIFAEAPQASIDHVLEFVSFHTPHQNHYHHRRNCLDCHRLH